MQVYCQSATGVDQASRNGQSERVASVEFLWFFVRQLSADQTTNFDPKPWGNCRWFRFEMRSIIDFVLAQRLYQWTCIWTFFSSFSHYFSRTICLPSLSDSRRPCRLRFPPEAKRNFCVVPSLSSFIQSVDPALFASLDGQRVLRPVQPGIFTLVSLGAAFVSFATIFSALSTPFALRLRPISVDHHSSRKNPSSPSLRTLFPFQNPFR